MLVWELWEGRLSLEKNNSNNNNHPSFLGFLPVCLFPRAALPALNFTSSAEDREHQLHIIQRIHEQLFLDNSLQQVTNPLAISEQKALMGAAEVSPITFSL